MVNTVSAKYGTGGGNVPLVRGVVDAAVRRLTPRECERLQGFPDDHTRIPWRVWQECKKKGLSYESELLKRGMKLREPAGEDCPDGPRYKAIGNSKAVPGIKWLGNRIKRHVAGEL